MHGIAIELNDAGIVVADADRVLGVEPGVAGLQAGRIITGVAAAARARLAPRETSNRFWDALSVESGSSRLRDVRCTAELAFAQIGDLWQRFGGEGAEGVFVVPGSWSREQLGVLLGLAKECGIPIRALVDAAVAASTRPFPGSQLLHVDASLHRVMVTPIMQGEEAVAGEAHELTTCGLASLRDTVAAWFADAFVCATRFDPLRRADTEQRLYDALPAWLDRLAEHDTIEVALADGAHERRVSIDRERCHASFARFNAAVAGLVADVRERSEPCVVQLSERLAVVPGLRRHLVQQGGVVVREQAVGAAARGALARLDALTPGGTTRLLRHLPWVAPPESPGADIGDARACASSLPRAVIRVPSHAVHRGVAWPIGAEGLAVVRAARAGIHAVVVPELPEEGPATPCSFSRGAETLRLTIAPGCAVQVNGQPAADGALLHVADRVLIVAGGAEFELVEVEVGDGS